MTNSESRQDDLLNKEDPRFFAIDKFGTGTASIATTEKVGNEIISFGLPSSPGLFLSLAQKFHSEVAEMELKEFFDKHPQPQGTYPDDHKNLFNFFEFMIGQIIFSYTAIETFSNIMIPKDYKFSVNQVYPKSSKEWDKDETERNLKLSQKLNLVLPKVLSVDKPDADIWDNFIELEKIRHRLIHLKSIDMKASGPEDETIWGDLLRNHKTDFVSQAHSLISHYIADKKGFRWFKKFPY